MTIGRDDMKFSLNYKDAVERKFAFVSRNKRTREPKYRLLTKGYCGQWEGTYASSVGCFVEACFSVWLAVDDPRSRRSNPPCQIIHAFYALKLIRDFKYTLP